MRKMDTNSLREMQTRNLRGLRREEPRGLKDLTYDLDLEKLQFFASRVTGMAATSRVNVVTLGRMALETIMMRRAVEETLDDKNATKDEAQKAKEALKLLQNLEQDIVRLYVIAGQRGKEATAPYATYHRYIEQSAP